MGLAAHVIVGGDAGGDVGSGAETRRVAFQDAGAQLVDRRRHLDLIAGGVQRLHRVVQGLKDRKIGGRSGGTGVGREIEQDQRDLALGG